MSFRKHRDIVGVNFSGKAGSSPVARPFPDLDGKLISSHMFGESYADHCPERIGQAAGVLYDWSGNERHINRWGRWRADDYWLICNVSSAMPRTSWYVDEILGGASNIAIVAFCQSDANAKAVWLARSLGAHDGDDSDLSSASDPYLALTLQPQTSSGRIQAGHFNGTLVAANLNPLPDELAEPSMFAGVYSAASRRSAARGPGAALHYSDPEATAKTLESEGHFIMGAETGSGAGSNRLIGLGFYLDLEADPTEELNLCHSTMASFQTSVGSGLVLT